MRPDFEQAIRDLINEYAPFTESKEMIRVLEIALEVEREAGA